jgi:hypothetical protein
MARRVACPDCGTSYSVPDTLAKPEAPCKKCGASIPLLAPAPAREPEPEAEPQPAQRPARPARRAAGVQVDPLKRFKVKPKPFYRTPVGIATAVAVLVCLYFGWYFTYGPAASGSGSSPPVAKSNN